MVRVLAVTLLLAWRLAAELVCPEAAAEQCDVGPEVRLLQTNLGLKAAAEQPANGRLSRPEPLFPEPAELPLYPEGLIPQFQDEGPEAFVPPDPNDAVGARCCPGDKAGHWYYNVSVPKLVPFELAEAKGAIVVAPGGGFEFLAWEKEGTGIAQWLNHLGFNAYVLKYRVPSTGDANARCIMDAQRAVSLVRSRSKAKGYNDPQVGFMGFSAGGGLTASVSVLTQRMYEPIDHIDVERHRPDYALLIYGAGDPAYASTAVPSFLAVAEDDQCVSSERVMAYYGGLKQANISADLHIYHEGRHGYGDCTLYTEHSSDYEVCAWTANAALWLNSQVLNNHNVNSVMHSPLLAGYERAALLSNHTHERYRAST